MSESGPVFLQSWSDVFQMLRAKAEASRGTVTLTADGAASATFPHTTTRDAFAIALVFDAAVGAHATRALVARWYAESNLLAGEPEDSIDPYIGNRSLWDTLAAVAGELDRMHAPLPALSVIDDAVRELETARPIAAPQMRNGAGAMLVTVFAEPTWKAMALRQLEFFRAMRGEVAGANPFSPCVPATCNGDVLALADYWSDQAARVGEQASDTFDRLLYSCWREVLHRVRRYARQEPAHEVYARNPEFWTALLLLTIQSDARDEAPTPWSFHVADPCHHRRNAAPVDSGATIDFPAAKTWDEAAKMQRDEFSRVRGEDLVTGRLITHVPRTTVADVRQLAAYWSAGLAKVGEHGFADVSYRHVVDRWKTAVAEIDRIPLNVDPSSVYAHNTDFWEALMTIAIQVAVTAESPTRWQLMKEATVQAIKDLPHTLKTATQDFVSDVLARPLVAIGLGIGGIALTLLLLRRSGSGRENKP